MRDPLLPPRLFANPVFVRGVAIAFFGAFALFAGTFLLPLFFQLVRGVDAAVSGVPGRALPRVELRRRLVRGLARAPARQDEGDHGGRRERGLAGGLRPARARRHRDAAGAAGGLPARARLRHRHGDAEQPGLRAERRRAARCRRRHRLHPVPALDGRSLRHHAGRRVARERLRQPARRHRHHRAYRPRRDAPGRRRAARRDAGDAAACRRRRWPGRSISPSSSARWRWPPGSSSSAGCATCRCARMRQTSRWPWASN